MGGGKYRPIFFFLFSLAGLFLPFQQGFYFCLCFFQIIASVEDFKNHFQECFQFKTVHVFHVFLPSGTCRRIWQSVVMTSLQLLLYTVLTHLSSKKVEKGAQNDRLYFMQKIQIDQLNRFFMLTSGSKCSTIKMQGGELIEY